MASSCFINTRLTFILFKVNNISFDIKSISKILYYINDNEYCLSIFKNMYMFLIVNAYCKPYILVVAICAEW